MNDILNTSVSEMTVTDVAWQKIHQLRYNNVDNFDMFYSDFFTTENKLKILKLIGITDKSFLCSLLFHKIDIIELKVEVSKLSLVDIKNLARDILEDINKQAISLCINSNGTKQSRA